MDTNDIARSLFEELRGEQLSAVTFVRDYLQLWFDGPGVNVTSPLTVRTPVSTITSCEPGFRDLLCGQIAKIVVRVERRSGEALVIGFEDGSEMSISLRKEEYRAAEAYYAHGFKNNAWLAE
jgi:hypothetical protein